MDICWLCVILAGIAVYLLTQFIRFIFADADLTLLWAARFGNKPESNLKGKVVWITGALSGIGEELSCQLAALGARLVLSARRENELERVKRICLERSSLKAEDILVLPLDLLDRASHQEKTATALKHFGDIDALINNGGRTQRSLCIEADVDLPHMIRRGSGIIATVSSVAGFVGAPLATGYAASKHAGQGFFNSLRTELADYPNITISTICPGPVISTIVQNAFTEELGKPVDTSGDQTHKMSTERCVHLTLVGLANHVKEMWIAEQPFLLFCYLWQYTPTLAWYLTNVLGKKRVQNFKAGLDADSAYFRKPKVKTT
uniref:Dehydrogenase/reductase (SDR family) member 7 n=1 Tax=Sinocyclocheilus anshuiensis TaxID=1608454 RepID=A0A671PXA2_9TELE